MKCLAVPMGANRRRVGTRQAGHALTTMTSAAWTLEKLENPQAAGRAGRSKQELQPCGSLVTRNTLADASWKINILVPEFCPFQPQQNCVVKLQAVQAIIPVTVVRVGGNNYAIGMSPHAWADTPSAHGASVQIGYPPARRDPGRRCRFSSHRTITDWAHVGRTG